MWNNITAKRALTGFVRLAQLSPNLLRVEIAPIRIQPFTQTEQFGQRVRADIALWGGIARSVNAKAD